MDTLKKFRRSISSSSTAQTTTIPSGKLERKNTWVHAPDVLLHGSVTYTLRLVGSRPVSKPKGADVVREAIHAIHFQNEARRAETSHDMAKLQKVDMRINVDGVTILDAKTKEMLYRYPLKRISFCSDDKQDKRYLAFIASEEDKKSTCLVFLSDKNSEEITRTIGEAFDLCYKKFMDSHKLDLQNQKEILTLRKRVAELEEENTRLSQLLAQKNKPMSETPALPSSPMPTAPPSSLLISPCPSHPPPKMPSPTGFLPPPSSLLTTSSSSSLPAPPIPARKTQPVAEVVNTSIFDDSFDPRSSSNSNGNHKTAEEYDTLINAVNVQLEEFGLNSTNDFALEIDNNGDAFKDVDNEYGCPKNIVDPKNMQEIHPSDANDSRPRFT